MFDLISVIFIFLLCLFLPLFLFFYSKYFRCVYNLKGCVCGGGGGEKIPVSGLVIRNNSKPGLLKVHAGHRQETPDTGQPDCVSPQKDAHPQFCPLWPHLGSTCCVLIAPEIAVATWLPPPVFVQVRKDSA